MPRPFNPLHLSPRHTTSRAHVCSAASGDLSLALPLAPSAVGNDYLRDRQPQESFALNLHLCGACGNVQIEDVVNPGPPVPALHLCHHLVARAGRALPQVRRRVDRGTVPRAGGSLVIDIGSNDGSLLRPSANAATA